MSKYPINSAETVVIPQIGLLLFTHVPAPVMGTYAGAPVDHPGTLVTFVSGSWNIGPGLRSVLISASSTTIDWRYVGDVFDMGTEPAQLTTSLIAQHLKLNDFAEKRSEKAQIDRRYREDRSDERGETI